MRTKIKNILFDWSGTLFDDFDVSFISTRATIKHFGGKNLSKKEYKEEFTLPVWKFYRRYIKKKSIHELNKFYFDHFANHAPHGRLFPQAKNVLKKAKALKIKLFIYSTVRQSILEKICHRYGIHSYFKNIQGDVRDKQKSLKSYLRKNRLKASETLFIGDTDHDLMAAKKNNLKSGAMLCGYQSSERLLKQAPDFVLNNHLSLLKFLVSLRAQRSNPVETAGSPRPFGARDDTQGPVSTVGALIFNKGDIFLVQTHKWSHTFGIPGGKIKKEETMEGALKREFWEETRLKLKNIHYAMTQDCIKPKEFYEPNRHFLLINYYADSSSRKFKLNNEAEAGFWINPKTALKLRLNKPTRILLKKYLD